MSNIVFVNDNDFEKVIENATFPILVDFWAEWCGPCKTINPILEQLSDELAGKITIAKMNVDDNPNTPTQFGVRSIPTLILFNNGKLVQTWVGATTKAQLTDFINKNI
ncbi:MAG: thioredoxin [Ostreibacterium sp.]